MPQSNEASIALNELSCTARLEVLPQETKVMTATVARTATFIGLLIFIFGEITAPKLHIFTQYAIPCNWSGPESALPMLGDIFRCLATEWMRVPICSFCVHKTRVFWQKLATELMASLFHSFCGTKMRWRIAIEGIGRRITFFGR